MAFPGSYSPAFTPRQSHYDEDPFSSLRQAPGPATPRPPPSGQHGSFSRSFLRPGDSSTRGGSDSRSPGGSGTRQLKATDLVRDVSSWLNKKRGKTSGSGYDARPWRGANDEMEWRNPSAGPSGEQGPADEETAKSTGGDEDEEDETLRRVMEESKREAESIEEREARELEEALELSRNEVPADAVNGSAFLDGGNETDEEDAEAELSRALRESERLLRQASLASPDSPTTASTMRARAPPAGAAPLDEKDFLEEDRMLELAVRLSLEERALYEEARNMAELAETTARWSPPPKKADKAQQQHGKRRVPPAPLPNPVAVDPTRSTVGAAGEGEVTPRAEQPESPTSAGSSRRKSLLEEQLAAASIASAPSLSPPRDRYTRKPLTPPNGSPPPKIVVGSSPPFPSRPPPPVPVQSIRKLPQPPPLPPKRPLENEQKVPFPTAPTVYSPPSSSQPDQRPRADSDPMRSPRSSTSSSSAASLSGRPSGPSQDPSYQSFHTAPLAVETPEPAPSSPDSLDAESPLDGPPLEAAGQSMYPRPSLTVGPYDAQRSLSHITEQTEPDDDGSRSLAAPSTRPPSSMSDDGAASTIGLGTIHRAGASAVFADADERPEQVFDDAEEEDEVAVRRLADVDTGLESGVAPQLSTATTVRGAGPSHGGPGTTTPRAPTPVQENPVQTGTASAAGSHLTHQSSTVDSPGFGNSVRFGFPDGPDDSAELAPPPSTTGSAGGMPDVIMLSKERTSFDGVRRGEGGSTAIGPVWAVDAASWSLLLRFLMWYGDSQLRASPDDLPEGNGNGEPGVAQKGRRSAALSVEFRKGGEGPGCVRLTVRLLDEDADGRGYESSGSNLTGGSGGEELAAGGTALNKKMRKRLQRRKGKSRGPALADVVSIDRVPLPDAVVLPTRLAQLAVTLFTLGHLAGIAVSTQGAKGATASYRELRRLGSLIADLAEAQRRAALASGRPTVEDEGPAGGLGDERLIGRMRERLRRLRNRQQQPSTATTAGSSSMGMGMGMEAGQAVMQQTAQASAATGLQPSSAIAAPAPLSNLGGGGGTGGEAMEPNPSQQSVSSSSTAEDGEAGGRHQQQQPQQGGRGSVRLRRRSRSSIERTRPVSRDLRLLMDEGDEPEPSTEGGHSSEAPAAAGGTWDERPGGYDDLAFREQDQGTRNSKMAAGNEWDHEDRLRWLPSLAR